MNKIKTSKEDRIFNFIVYTVLGLALLVVLYPLYFVVIASFSDPNEVINGKVFLLPKGITFDGYARVFRDARIWTGYMNSVIYTVAGTAIGVMATMMIAYPLSMNKFSGKRWITVFIFIPMYFGGGLIPTYLLMKSLGLLGTRLAVILMGCISTYNIIICMSFLKANIPSDLEEAAELDGCSHFRFFFSMVMPLSKAVMAVLILYYGVGHWNDYFNAMIYLKDSSQYPLQLILRSILLQAQNSSAMIDDITMAEELMRITEQIKYGVIKNIYKIRLTE